MTERHYPYVPRQANQLRAGELWSIALEDGRYACGVVLDPVPLSPHNQEPMGNGLIVVGLMDWVGELTPTVDEIEPISRVLRQAYGAATTISRDGGEIVGCRDLAANPVELDEMVSHRGGGPVWILSAGRRVREATEKERVSLRILGGLGYSGFKPGAERHFR